VLAGEDQRRSQSALDKRECDWLQFDGFGSGADDQPDVSETQLSP
jgi:hypothetical protein